MHFTRGKSALARATALAYRRLKYAVAAPVVSAVMTYTPWPDGGDAPPKALNYSADGDFVAQGDELVETVQRDFALDGGERILDVGCGFGRIATGLYRAERDVRYWGFDIVRYGILWCKQKMSESEGYHFTHADIYNPFYNKRGRIGEAFIKRIEEPEMAVGYSRAFREELAAAHRPSEPWQLARRAGTERLPRLSDFRKGLET